MKKINKNKDKQEIYFLSLGGVGEIGLNCYMYGFKDKAGKTSWIIVDCGVTFRDHKYKLLDLFVPKIDFIKQNKKNILGIIITHGHEDHIGALSYLHSDLASIPIFMNDYNRDLLLNKKNGNKYKIKSLERGKKITLGAFDILPFNVEHSIPEAQCLLIEVGGKNIVHTGDWKVDEKSLFFKKRNIRDIKGKQVDYLFCDSTNIFVDGFSKSENLVKKAITSKVLKSKSATWITCFASNIERINTILSIAQKYKKKVVLVGLSFVKNIEIAKKHGLIDSKYRFMQHEEARKYKNRSDLLFLVSGSQGQEMASLYNIVINKSHPLKIKKDDAFIFSSKTIIGNEVKVARLKNALCDLGVLEFDVKDDENLHVSGHPCRKDIQLIYKLLKPRCVVPIHGEAMHIHKQCEFALENKISAFASEKGQILMLNGDMPRIKDIVPVGKDYPERNKILDYDGKALKTRIKSFYEGVVNISLVLNKNLKTVVDLNVLVLGIVEENEEQGMNNDLLKLIKNFLAKNTENDLQYISKELTTKVKKYIKDIFYKKPLTSIYIYKDETK